MLWKLNVICICKSQSIMVHPLNYAEFMSAQHNPGSYDTNLLLEYMQYGGLPIINNHWGRFLLIHFSH